MWIKSQRIHQLYSPYLAKRVLFASALLIYCLCSIGQTPISSSANIPALGFYTDSHVYIFDGQAEEWVIGPLDGPIITHNSSTEGFAFATATRLNFYHQEKRIWRSLPIEGYPIKILQSGNSIGLLTSKFAYVLETENNHFSEVFLGGNAVDMVDNKHGSYAVCTDKVGYIYMAGKESWFSKEITGEFAGIFSPPLKKP